MHTIQTPSLPIPPGAAGKRAVPLQAFGSLKTKRQAYAAAEHMVASLGDRYSEFLQPTAYRRAIRRPQPAEREYLAAQFTGTGIQVGPCCQQLDIYPACSVMLCKRCWP